MALMKIQEKYMPLMALFTKKVPDPCPSVTPDNNPIDKVRIHKAVIKIIKCFSIHVMSNF